MVTSKGNFSEEKSNQQQDSNTRNSAKLNIVEEKSSPKTPEDTTFRNVHLGTNELPPIRTKEYLALFFSVILGDITVYHGGGFSGFSVLFFLMPVILFLCVPVRKSNSCIWIMLIMLLILSFRLFWLGSSAHIFTGLFLLCAFSIVLTGEKPFLLETLLHTLNLLLKGIQNLLIYARYLHTNIRKKGFSYEALLIPSVLGAVFVFIFVMANPVLKDFVVNLRKNLWLHIKALVPSWSQVLFWVAVLWCVAGLLRPGLSTKVSDFFSTLNQKSDPRRFAPAPGYAYPASLNTLIVLIIIFAIYLVFEFYYLWIREIPKGFRYSEYAHEGAAWLTFALAVSTVVLGVIFYGGLREHPRIARLKKITWLWIAENFILAICAFHRTQIYVHYNGMSRMRVVAVVGISLVVAGFILVVWKVAQDKSFWWLVRHHLWALFIAVFLFEIMPVDYFVTRYNVKEILSGNPAPSVQIAYHPIGVDGCLQLLPLLHCEDDSIREGVKALLAKIEDGLEKEKAKLQKRNWTYFQMGKYRALRILKRYNHEWKAYTNIQLRNQRLSEFRSYTRQWYD